MNIKKNIDKKLLGVIIFLTLFGLLMSFSSSVYYSNTIADNPFYFFIKQCSYLLVSIVFAFIAFKIPINKWQRYSILLFLITILLLVLVFVPVIGIKANGSYRWLNLVFFTFQPSELMKLAIILFMSGFLVRREFDVKETTEGIFKTIFFLVVVCSLLLFETDFGATIIIFTTAMAMLFIAEVRLKEFIFTVPIISFLLIGLISFFPERVARISSFLNPWDDPYGKSYQLIQSLIAIGSGGWFGSGIGSSVQKYNFLPDSHTDFVFAIVGEELGVVGMLLVVFCFSYIIYKGLIISKESLKQGNKYNSYTAYGISIWFFLQIFINIGVNTGLLPTKGLTLPLFSYGGSSILITLITLAILLRIDVENKYTYIKRGVNLS